MKCIILCSNIDIIYYLYIYVSIDTQRMTTRNETYYLVRIFVHWAIKHVQYCTRYNNTRINQP